MFNILSVNDMIDTVAESAIHPFRLKLLSNSAALSVIVSI